jgi:hypothetical protein
MRMSDKLITLPRVYNEIYIINGGKYNVNDFMATCRLKLQLYNYCIMPEIQRIYELKN